MNTTTSSLIDEIKDLLQRSVSDVIDTMFGMTAVPGEVQDFRGCNETLVAGSVGFIGDVNGMVYIYVRASFARVLASRMLGLTEADIDGDEMVNDVIGELSNMIVGSVKSRLCDSGAPCVLTIPSIVRGQNLRLEPAGPSDSRVFTMLCDTEAMFVEVIMKRGK